MDKELEFRKIKLAPSRVLEVEYMTDGGDAITLRGANIVHKDLREAMRGLVPHLVLLLEMPEGAGKTLEELQTEMEKEKNALTGYAVNSVILRGEQVMMCGSRILKRGEVTNVQAPLINIETEEQYEYVSELWQQVENVVFEATAYVTEQKWGLKEGTLDFDAAGDPFADGVKGADPIEAVKVEIEVAPAKKKGRKKKTLIQSA